MVELGRQQMRSGFHVQRPGCVGSQVGWSWELYRWVRGLCKAFVNSWTSAEICGWVQNPRRNHLRHNCVKNVTHETWTVTWVSCMDTTHSGPDAVHVHGPRQTDRQTDGEAYVSHWLNASVVERQSIVDLLSYSHVVLICRPVAARLARQVIPHIVVEEEQFVIA